MRVFERYGGITYYNGGILNLCLLCYRVNLHDCTMRDRLKEIVMRRETAHEFNQANPSTKEYPEDFETYIEADTRRKHRVRVLRRGIQADQLAGKLDNCKKNARCESEACPVCVGHF